MVSDAEKGTLGEAAAPFSAVAHCAQNFARGGLSVPQDGHLSANDAAHSMQNLALSGFSAPHFVHFTPIPLETDCAELRANLTKTQSPNLHLHHRWKKQSRHVVDRIALAQSKFLSGRNRPTTKISGGDSPHRPIGV
jgi:hypothetical protein